MGKRVIIIDFNHLAHTYMNSHHRLSKTMHIGTQVRTVDTTVQNGVIKAIHRWSKGGYYPTAVCFDSPVPSRKGYFAKAFGMEVDGDSAYKGGRKSMGSDMYEAIGMTKDILVSAGVSCFKGDNYEADDLIFACVQKAKEDYPDLPIDVITNDADLLPLVDETVSVFLRSKKSTYAVTKDLEKPHYVQVTPENYQEVVEDLSAYRKFKVPYNTLLLQKLLRGDSSDNIGEKVKEVKKLFPPKKYNELIERMENQGVDFSTLFRYGSCVEKIVSIKTGEEVDSSHDRSDMALKYEDAPELVKMVDYLCWYIEDEEVITHIKKMYRGMNLNQAYTGLGNISRKPAKLAAPIKPFDELVLQARAIELGINLRISL